MFGRNKRIYLDYASATPVAAEAKRVMTHAMQTYANPGALHAEGVVAKRMLENAREHIAAHLGCKAREIIFTSGLTEANNIGIVGYARNLMFLRQDPALPKTHWIVSSIEHSSVLECFAEVERMGGNVTHVDPNPDGIIAVEKVNNALRPETVLVSVGWGNNEIGTIQSLSEIARALRVHEKKHNSTVALQSDAGQAPLYRRAQVHSLGVDMFSLGSGKLYGPRGIGALYVSNRVGLVPVVFGGGQERGLRSGTEDPALAAGFAEAYDVIASEREWEVQRLRKLRDNFAHEIIGRIPGVIINGDLSHALPHMLNISIPGDRSGEYLVLALDHADVALSTKSACREGEARSHVVEALGGDSWRAQNTLRFSLGRDTTERDLKRTVATLAELCET